MLIYLSKNLHKTDNGLGKQAPAARVRLYLKQMNVAESVGEWEHRFVCKPYLIMQLY